MNSNDKFLLLFSLFFFMGFLFFSLLITNVSKKSASASVSVLYSSQTSAAGVVQQAISVPCYLDETFKKMMDDSGMGDGNSAVAAEGDLDNGMHLAIHVRNDNGNFVVATHGQDASGVSQNCRVLSGTGFHQTK